MKDISASPFDFSKPNRMHQGIYAIVEKNVEMMIHMEVRRETLFLPSVGEIKRRHLDTFLDISEI